MNPLLPRDTPAVQAAPVLPWEPPSPQADAAPSWPLSGGQSVAAAAAATAPAALQDSVKQVGRLYLPPAAVHAQKI